MGVMNDKVENSVTDNCFFNQRKLPGVLGVVGNQYIESCRQLIEWTFVDAQDSLSASAATAKPNSKLNIDKLQSKVADVVEAALLNAFYRLLQSNTHGHTSVPTLYARNAQTKLSVVKNGAFEFEYLLRDTASQIRQRYYQYLDVFIKRLDHLILPAEITELNNPLEPLLFVEAFIAACTLDVKMDQRSKAAVYEELQQQMLEVLPICYRDANEALSRAGILPHK